MAKTDNPAGRLHEILTSAKNIPSPNLHDNTVKYRYAKLFEINPNDTAKVLHRMLQVHRLFDDVELELRKSEDVDEDLFLSPLSRLRLSIPIQNIDLHWGKCIEHLSDADLTALAFISHELAKRPSEDKIDAEVLMELLGDIDALYQEVLASSLEPNLKILILERLEAIRQAIHEYRIRGIARLREELAASVGTLLINEDLIKQSSNTAEVQKFGKLITKLATYSSLASNVIKIAESVIKYLPSM